MRRRVVQPRHLAALAALACLRCNWVLGLDEVDPAKGVTFEEHAEQIGARPADVAIGDVELDGTLDVMVTTGGNMVSVIWNRTAVAAAFATEVTKLDLEAARRFVTIGLVPQPADAAPDLILIDTAGTAYRVANNNGTLAPASTILFAVAPGSQVLVARFEPVGTDASTVLVATPGLAAVTVHRVVADVATPLAGVTLDQPFVAWTAAPLTAADPLDLVIAASGGMGVHVGQFVTGPFGPFAAAAQTFIALGVPIAAGALDADPHRDVVARVLDERAVLVLRGDGAGGFPDQIQIDLDFAPSAIAALDVDGDRRGDVCVAGPSGADTIVQCALADGAGGFVRAPPLTVDGQLVKLATGDFDRDGKVDLVLVLELSATDGEVRFLLQR